jgi:hypothetical protein
VQCAGAAKHHASSLLKSFEQGLIMKGMFGEPTDLTNDLLTVDVISLQCHAFEESVELPLGLKGDVMVFANHLCISQQGVGYCDVVVERVCDFGLDWVSMV